jgi:uncharacterized membrane protein YqaE (UPF0057 family)
MNTNLDGPRLHSNLCLSFLAFFLPPMAVTLKVGRGCPTQECGCAALLCLLGFLPAFVYSLVIIWSGAYDPQRPIATAAPLSGSASGAPRVADNV